MADAHPARPPPIPELDGQVEAGQARVHELRERSLGITLWPYSIAYRRVYRLPMSRSFKKSCVW